MDGKKTEVPVQQKTDGAKEPTFTRLEGEAFLKWLNKQPLTEREQKIIDRRFKKTGKTPQDFYKSTAARLKAKVDTFEELLDRKATPGEIRRMFFADPFGILEPEELPEGLTEETVQHNMEKFNKTREEVIEQFLRTRNR